MRSSKLAGFLVSGVQGDHKGIKHPTDELPAIFAAVEAMVVLLGLQVIFYTPEPLSLHL